MARQREDSMSVVFRDLLILLALLMLTLVVLLIPLIKIKSETTGMEKTAGDMVAEIVWDSKSTADIDLWAEAPTGEKAGYSMPFGKIFNLVRDDLGRDVDFSGLNYEFIFSRGIPDGRYRFSIVYYADNDQGKAPVDVRVSIRHRKGRLMIAIHEIELTLDYPGQEKGVISFSMKNGQMIPGSNNFEPFEIFHSTIRQSKGG